MSFQIYKYVVCINVSWETCDPWLIGRVQDTLTHDSFRIYRCIVCISVSWDTDDPWLKTRRLKMFPDTLIQMTADTLIHMRYRLLQIRWYIWDTDYSRYLEIYEIQVTADTLIHMTRDSFEVYRCIVCISVSRDTCDPWLKTIQDDSRYVDTYDPWLIRSV